MTATKQKAAQVVLTEEAPAEPTLLQQILAHVPTQKADDIASRYCEALRAENLGRLSRAMVLAQGIAELRQAVTPEMMKRVMALMNTDLGFKTDRPSKRNNTPYDEGTVKECLIHALLSGVYPTDNEFNIIAARMYIALNGYSRKCRETTGLTDLKLAPGLPTLHNGKTVVRVAASWKFRGVPDALRDGEGKLGRVFEIPSQEFSGPDQIIGKAKRKALKAVFEQIHGSEHTPEDGEVGEAEVRPFTSTDRTISRLEHNLAQANGGRALPAVLEDIRVELEGRDMTSDEAAAFLPDGVEEFAKLTVPQAESVLDALKASAPARTAESSPET